jgi:tRNA-specific 2-thiouridylase
MAEPRRVLVAMSGGVDSGMAAALLVERGYHVAGITLRLWREPSTPEEAEAEPDAIASARAICAHLGIPHEVLDVRQVFQREVVAYFGQEYLRGRTPNPCLRCNRWLKFGLLLDEALRRGYDFLATGHYVRLRRQGELYQLWCGVDEAKDQSYVLYALRQEHLRYLLFPLGEYTKDQVRALARARGLPAAERPESQDICFLRDNDYRRFLRERWPAAGTPGPIVDRQGRYLGEHKGLAFYTVGQREGLGIAAPRPLYVLALDVARNALVVGHAEALGRDTFLVEEVSYISGEPPDPGTAVEVKIRYRAPRVPARVETLPGQRARVILARPLRDITPGQAAVFYEGEQLLGGGIIAQVADLSQGQEEGAW